MSHLAREILVEHIKKNQEKFYKIAYTYTKNEEIALDVVQETITKALENITKVRQEEYVKTWFYRILINEALKTYKKNKKYIEYEIKENEEYSHSNEEKLVDNMDIYNSLQKLNSKLKTVIILRFFENLKLEEIAFITKTNISTVKSRLYKGLNEMKNSIDKR